MIIRIEDAPGIKHIKIDINFEDNEDSPNIKVDYDKAPIKKEQKPKASKESIKESSSVSTKEDISLNLDEDYSVSEEIVEKPAIPEIEREVKVSDDMINATF